MNKKRKIVLASLLKPVNDPRMYEKFALSMSQTNKYAINIIGFSSKNIPVHKDIHFHPLFNFGRLSYKRLLSPFRYFQKLLQVKPELIIVNSHDLLIVSCAYKILFGSKVIYDVMENYKANIIWSSNLPMGLNYLLAYTVRLKEQIAKRMIIHFYLAEKCYINECSFISDAYTILENKALMPSANSLFHLKEQELLIPGRAEKIASKDPLQGKKIQPQSSPTKEDIPINNPQLKKQDAPSQEPPLRLIYSGTIAESYGIFDCLKLTDNWISQGKSLHLTIIGHCPRQDTFNKLARLISGRPYITLIGGKEHIPHQHILEELQKADFSLISYQLNPSNEHCMPTRIWECLAYKVPMIMKKEHPWTGLLKEYQAGISLDFNAPAPENIPDINHQRYYPHPIPDSLYWEYEAEKLINSLETLF